jgi:hypothetical protein
MRAVTPLSLACFSFGFYYVPYSCFHCLPLVLMDVRLLVVRLFGWARAWESLYFGVFKADLSTNKPCVSHFQGNLHDSRYFPYVVMK